MGSTSRAAMGAAALLAALAGGSARADTGTSVAAIANGEPDTAHPNVVGIARPSEGSVGICTGTLLLPNLVITARHCVGPLSADVVICEPYTDRDGTAHEATTAEEPWEPGSMYVTTAPKISRGADFVRVAEVIVLPGSTGASICGRDVALLRLARPLEGVTPAEPRLDIRPRRQETFTAVGYGATGGSGEGAGTRRIRRGLRVEQVGAVGGSARSLTVAEAEWRGNEGTCQGDSGGPTLDELGQVFGVLSRGVAQSCESPVYARLDSFADWIREHARRAVELSGGPAPAWLEPPPAASAGEGEACRADAQCVAPLACEVRGDGRVCAPGGEPPERVMPGGGCSASPAHGGAGARLAPFGFLAAVALWRRARRRPWRS